MVEYDVRLVPYTDEDLWLTEAFELDPAMMTYLGGLTTPRDQIAERHQRRVQTNAKGDWWFKILPEGEERGAGTIGIWRYEEEGRAVAEMGWMILPAFQGRGLCSRAGRMVIDRARAERKFGPVIVAHPNVENAASNRICEKLGFVKKGERDLKFRGEVPFRSAVWELTL